MKDFSHHNEIAIEKSPTSKMSGVSGKKDILAAYMEEYTRQERRHYDSLNSSMKFNDTMTKFNNQSPVNSNLGSTSPINFFKNKLANSP